MDMCCVHAHMYGRAHVCPCIHVHVYECVCACAHTPIQNTGTEMKERVSPQATPGHAQPSSEGQGSDL